MTKTLTDYEVWNETGVIVEAIDYIQNILDSSQEDTGEKELIKRLRQCYKKLSDPHEKTIKQ